MIDGPASYKLRNDIELLEAEGILIGYVKQLCLDERYQKMVAWAVKMREKAIDGILKDPGDVSAVSRAAGQVDILDDIIAQEASLDAKLERVKQKIQWLRGRTREAETADTLGFGFNEKGVAG